MQYDIEMSDYFQREYFQREQQQRMMYNGGGGAPAADYPEYEYERRQQIRQVIGILTFMCLHGYITLVAMYLGWVDLYFESSVGWWAPNLYLPTVHRLNKMIEYPNQTK